MTTDYCETPDIETCSEDYAGRFSGPVGTWFLDLQQQITLKMLQDYPNASILDVGGGHGQVLAALVQGGFDVTVLDSAEICQARIREFIESGQAIFVTGNLLDLPYPDGAFDVVLSYRLLPHINQWQRLIAELARVARRAVILDYPDVHSLNQIAPQLFQLKKKLEGNTRNFTLFRRAELIEEFSKHRFTCSAYEPEFFLPMVLHRKLNAVKASSAAEGFFRHSGLTRSFGSPVIIRFTRNGQD
jgi:ubiquinone/menaquinone biosynthesis C-methylase UbiE